MGWLDGKVALAVGGGSGIGRGVVEEFMREGASIGVLELNPDKCAELCELGPDVTVIQGDATSLEDNKRAVQKTVETFGRLDTLMTFVGIFDFYTPLSKIPEDKLKAAFDETFETNVGSYLLSAKAALPELKKSGGSIIFTVSTSGFYPGRGGILYVASKFAVRGMVIQLAHEVAPEVRVNGVAPGGTMSTDLRGLKSIGLNQRSLGNAPNREDDLRSRTPLRLAMRPKDHAGAYIYLASDRARGITGMIINSDGGIGVRG
ncbi:3-phenylpropionate-dihydrodiol/cinnamic acid-dihydrodiol dehydrogenase [Rubrobacter xylanophilus]|uniref:3-phenylpropionate-dihydrodiol/cinnamic acid-dihydrodiol dehydrogenase n=2 Tax=Rubrobacter xylanophilus TaxID=49319 RepID=A0A510HL34_9ACTN|nr:3-(cis-5,6-dihydroxycyclohexa-1,3-dien-1-yl)propanoate dehydrogenase [Rubrobacter xylanophilus]BBL80736.1 3-phenylpropionate-dihydrodiol/cinnamic acid-dihydrodiol dehydrogenase [Rubrobacter xylanophilus]